MIDIMFDPPEIRDVSAGEPMALFEVCRIAGIPPRLSTGDPPDIRIHEGEAFFRVDPEIAWKCYCMSGPALPERPSFRAYEILLRAAFQFHDWASVEIVATQRRFWKREMAPLLERHEGLSYVQARACAAISLVREITREDLASSLRMSVTDLDRAIAPIVDGNEILERLSGGEMTLRLGVEGGRRAYRCMGRLEEAHLLAMEASPR